MKTKKQWIGMLSIDHNPNYMDGYYISSLYDPKSWDAEWIIDGPYEYYNILYLKESKNFNKIYKKDLYKEMRGGHFEDNAYAKSFRITKMLNVE